MDLSRAYDCLSHDLLIAKLTVFGFGNTTLALITDYITNRASFSSYLEILRNVPKGSILGPILFNLFINDLIFFIKKAKVCNFADDTTIYSCSLNNREEHRKLSNDTQLFSN